MKKILLLSLCLLLAVGGLGCKRKEPEPQTADAAMIPDPVKELDSPDFKKAGFKVVEYTKEYELVRCAEIGGAVGEMVFDLPRGEMTLRISNKTGEDISGYYISFNEPDIIDADGTAVTIRTASDSKGTAVCQWEKDGYTFSLAFEGIEDEALPQTASAILIGTIVMDPHG